VTASAAIDRLFTAGPPALDAGPRAHVLPVPAVRALVAGLAAEGLAAAQLPCLEGVALLWHDHLDAAHVIAQEHEDADGNFLHAVMHRREGDFANSAWWWRRVGRHDVFDALTVAAGTTASGGSTGWDPEAFVTRCQEALTNGDAAQQQALIAVQAIELTLFARHLLDSRR